MSAPKKQQNKTTPKDLSSLSVRLKWQMNDIIHVAYKDYSAAKIDEFKKFRVYCTTDERRSFLGDCTYGRDGTSQIRIFALGSEGYKETLITLIHEAAHHIDHAMRGTSRHDSNFYAVHKRLLFAAFDMGILDKTDVINSSSHAQNRDKLARMMKDYEPHPVPYKKDRLQLSVYDSYAVKDELKARGFTWNPLDQAWTREVKAEEEDAERSFLGSIGVKDENIRVLKGNAVVTRLRKTARIYNAPFEANATIKQFGYRWVNTGRSKYWERMIDGSSIPRKEEEALAGVGVKVTVSD